MNKSSETVKTLVENFKNSGSQIDFAKLYYRFEPGLRKYISNYQRYSNNPYIHVDDILNDTFISAYTKFYQYDDSYAFSTWLYAIARRHFLNAVFSTKKMLKHISIDKLNYFLESAADNENSVQKYPNYDIIDDYIDNVHKEMKYMELYYLVINKIKKHGKHGEMVIDKYFNGMPGRDVANKYKINYSTCRVQLKNTLEKVRYELYKDGINFSEFIA